MAVQVLGEKNKKNRLAYSKLNRDGVGSGVITQKDIAQLAGVSITTVYNALHVKDAVKPHTRSRILKLMEDYDYQPNGIARAMVRGKTEVIGILVPRIDVRYYSALVAGIENSVNTSGYNCIICQHLDDMLKEEREINLMRERRVDGIIVRTSGHRESADTYDRLERAGVPFVLVDREIKGIEGHFVGSDSFQATKEITEYLIKKGHKKIAVAVWPETSMNYGVKYDSFRGTLEEHGIEFDERYLIMCSSEYFAGRDGTLEMMNRVGSDRPTAVLSLNDTSILGVIQAFVELGISIPDDIAVANIGGCVEGELGPMSRFKLTCSLQPVETVGRESAQMLREQIGGSNWKRGPILCPSQIRVGNSA